MGVFRENPEAASWSLNTGADYIGRAGAQLRSAISGGDNKFNIIAQWQMLFILGWISLLTLLRQ